MSTCLQRALPFWSFVLVGSSSVGCQESGRAEVPVVVDAGVPPATGSMTPPAAAPTAGAAAPDAAAGAAGRPPGLLPAAAGAAAALPAAMAGAAAPAQVSEPGIARPGGWADASHARGAEPDYARLFDGDRVRRLDIELSAASKQAMYDDLEMLLGPPNRGSSGAAPGMGGMGGRPGMGPGGNPTDLVGGEPIYVPVTVRYEGGVWTRVGMRFKGNSSLVSAWRTGVKKIGFRLDFDRYEKEYPETLDQRFFGFGKMTFSSGFRDASLIRDKLAAEILAGQGLVSARAAFYRIYVDAGAGPEYWGLYTMIEDPADQLVEVQFADDSGNLYKPDGPAANLTMFDPADFEKKSNEEAADFSDVMALIEALHAPRTDAASWRAGLEAVFDVQTFLEVLAFSRSIGHWDGYGVMAHNYYLYGDPTLDGRLVWISWDHNLTWQGSGGFSFGALGVMMDEVTERWPLIRFLLDDPLYRADYSEALGAMLGGPYEKARFDARATALHALVAPWIVGGNGESGERAPFTFVTDPNQFRNALSDPMRGLLVSADNLRQAVRTAIGP
jgi:spore coat protein H